mmetsp:Transcript_177591/g.569539  ORF Transcript_177591/g.569539 Transcript_177591/m.569539 type:complete len:96 (-) Transcript_177591:325-612(-)
MRVQDANGRSFASRNLATTPQAPMQMDTSVPPDLRAAGNSAPAHSTGMLCGAPLSRLASLHGEALRGSPSGMSLHLHTTHRHSHDRLREVHVHRW